MKTPEKKTKSRITQAAKPDPKTPAKLVPFKPPAPSAPDAAPAPQNNAEQFDRAKVVETLNIWWQNGTKKFFRPTPNGKEWISVGEQSIRRTLRLNGVKTRAVEGASFSQADS